MGKPVHKFELRYSWKQNVKLIDVEYIYLSVDDKPSYAITIEQAKELVKVLNKGIRESTLSSKNKNKEMI